MVGVEGARIVNDRIVATVPIEIDTIGTVRVTGSVCNSINVRLVKIDAIIVIVIAFIIHDRIIIRRIEIDAG